MLLLAPHPISAITGGLENLLTPSPREVWQAVGGAFNVTVDLGVQRTVDAVFLGFTNVSSAAWALETSLDATTWTPRFGPELVPGDPAGPGGRHACRLFAAPFEARHFRFGIDTGSYGAPHLRAGVLMIGRTFLSPHEKGGGRGIVDTGTREDLADGGWAGEDGVRLRTLSWRFAGLTDDQVDQLEDIALDRGRRGPLVAFEHRTMAPITEAYPSRRMIYGVFDKFETAERLDPRDTRWSFSMIERR